MKKSSVEPTARKVPDDGELKKMFSYHAATPAQQIDYELVRAGALKFARLIAKLVPDSDEAALAIARVREAMFLANAGIACRTPAPKE